MIDKFKFSGLVSFLLILVTMFYSCKTTIKTGEVAVSERQILVNNEAYLIKGICYHPVPKGSNELSFETIDQDLALMVEAGVNTIRVYVPIDDVEVLDKIHEAGLKIIIGFGYNQNGYYDMLSGSFIDYVNKYKNHKAILFWELGNEFNYHPEWFEGDIKNWYASLNSSAELIHKNDTNHPVATAHGELPNDEALLLSPNIDIWGMNVYRWDNPETIFSEWEKISTKPMYLSEAGADSFMTIAKDNYQQGVNEKAQAIATKSILEATFKNTKIGSGVTLFQFTDGWWKAGDLNTQDPGGWAPNSSGVPYDGTPNEEYWGIVTIDRTKKEAYQIVKEVYTNTINKE